MLCPFWTGALGKPGILCSYIVEVMCKKFNYPWERACREGKLCNLVEKNLTLPVLQPTPGIPVSWLSQYSSFTPQAFKRLQFLPTIVI